MQMCPSWPKEHDWKSCKRKTRFKSSNLFICAIKIPETVVFMRSRGFFYFIIFLCKVLFVKHLKSVFVRI